MDDNKHRASVKVSVVIFTLAMVVLAILNLFSQWNSEVITDGVRWRMHQGMLLAEEISLGSAAEDAGLQPGDLLRAINFRSVVMPQDVGKILYQERYSLKPLQYEIIRANETFIKLVTPRAKTDSFYFFLATIGFVILAIGVFAFLKSRSRDFAFHFYFLCLGFFGLYAFSPTGEFNTLDWIFFFADETFLLLLPAMFLHFAFYFPDKSPWAPSEKILFVYVLSSCVRQE